LALQINRARNSCGTEAVHHVRVAIRRFTRAIAVGRPYIRAADVRKNRRRLKKIMNGAGDVRNCDVTLKFIARFRVPQAVDLRSKLQERRKESAGLLIIELKKWAGKRMTFKWRAALNSTPDKDAFGEEPSREMAARALARAMQDFLQQGNEASSPEASPERLHRFRLVAKKFRYLVELFQPLYGSSIDPIVESVKRASALLGDINDCATVAGIVAEYKGGHRLADRLKKRQRKKTEEFRRYWDEFRDGGQLRSWIANLSGPAPEELKKPVASSAFSSRPPSRKSAVA